MSYEYARVPLKPGLNIICGPNGSGKSSILLAISVALGQAYTERSRRLSDLIRWGKDTARVTLIFDNSKRGGRRPVPKVDADTIRLSRYLKKDGDYWFELNFRTVMKAEVARMLSEVGIDPDNMLIIMHQNMMEEFGIISPQQKMKMVEEAVGLGDYRIKILDAQDRLNRVLGEEESINNLLNNAEQTLAYWKGEYDRYQRRKELLQKRELLERELGWAQVIRQERAVQSWEEKVNNREEAYAKLTREAEETKRTINTLHQDLNRLRHDQRRLFYSLLEIEKQMTESEVTVRLFSDVLNKLKGLGEEARGVENPTRHSKTIQEELRGLENYMVEIESQVQLFGRKRQDLEGRVASARASLADADEKVDTAANTYLEVRVKEAILNFQRERTEDELAELRRQLREAQRDLNQLRPAAERTGLRVSTERSPSEVSEEIKVTAAYLASLPPVSADAEKMFASYSTLYNDLKTKAAIVSENRERALQEIEERKRTWRRLMGELLDRVNPTFQNFLEKIDAVGRVRLMDVEDVETAGLEVTVGFKGAEPTILDNYTQSGGERSTAVMAFLIALQQHVKSTIRAVDEFDVHMDPRNRETISNLIVSEMKGWSDVQYIVITPGQVTGVDEGVHVITVQNVKGRSDVMAVAEAEQ